MPNVLSPKHKTYICSFIFGIGTFIKYHFVIGHAGDFLPEYGSVSVILLNVFILIAKLTFLTLLTNFNYNQKIFGSLTISTILYIGLFLFFNFYPINNSPEIDTKRILFFLVLLVFICLQQALNEIVFCGINTFYNSTAARFYSSGTGASGMLSMLWLYISSKFKLVYYYEFIYYVVLSVVPYFLYYMVLDRKYIYRREKHLNELHNNNHNNDNRGSLESKDNNNRGSLKSNNINNEEERSETAYSQSYTKSKTYSYTSVTTATTTTNTNNKSKVKLNENENDKYNNNVIRKETKRINEKEILREKYKHIELDTFQAKIKVVLFELMEYNLIWTTCYIFTGLFTGGIANYYNRANEVSNSTRAMQLTLLRTAAFIGRTMPLFVVIEYLKIWPSIGLLTTIFAFVVIEVNKITFGLYFCFILIGLTYGAGLGYSILSIKKNKPFKIAKIGLEFSNFNSQLRNAIGSSIGLAFTGRYRNRL